MKPTEEQRKVIAAAMHRWLGGLENDDRTIMVDALWDAVGPIVRDATLEEAARVCEEEVPEFWRLADTIRSLKSKP